MLGLEIVHPHSFFLATNKLAAGNPDETFKNSKPEKTPVHKFYEFQKRQSVDLLAPKLLTLVGQEMQKITRNSPLFSVSNAKIPKKCVRALAVQEQHDKTTR